MTKFSSPFLAKSPLKQEGGKFGHRDPGTGWSQKEKLDDPEGHKKAVKGGLKTLPAIALAGVASTFTPAALPIVAKATAGAAGILGLKDLGENIVNFYSGAKNTKMKAARKEVEKNKSPLKNDTFGGTPDSTDKQKAYKEAANQLYKEGKITESNDRADRLITKRMKKNAKKFAKSIK